MKKVLVRTDKESVKKAIRKTAEEQSRLAESCLYANWEERLKLLREMNRLTLLLVDYGKMLREISEETDEVDKQWVRWAFSH